MNCSQHFSHKYFCNKECEFYPCHENIDDMNCLFCYCPLYKNEKCPGTYEYIESNGNKIKDCSGCTFVHNPDNYDIIIKILSKGNE